MSRPNTIIDGHVHLASSLCIPRAFFIGIARNMHVQMQTLGNSPSIDTVVDIMLSNYQDHQGDKLIQQMDEAGVQSAVLLAPDFTYALDSDQNIEQIAAQHFEVLQRHPNRFHVLQGIDPRTGQKGHDFFESTIVDYGFKGLKVYPPCGFSPSDKIMYPLYEICHSRQLPVLIHTGPTSPALSFATANPSLIDQAALDFPDVNFILAHGGVNFCEEAILMSKYRPNVYLDISGFVQSRHPQGWQAHLAELFTMDISHKIIFGTDWPVFGSREGMAYFLDKIFDSDSQLAAVSAATFELCMSKNISRLLGI